MTSISATRTGGLTPPFLAVAQDHRVLPTAGAVEQRPSTRRHHRRQCRSPGTAGWTRTCPTRSRAGRAGTRRAEVRRPGLCSWGSPFGGLEALTMRAPTRGSVKQIGRHGLRAVERCGNGRFFVASFTVAPILPRAVCTAAVHPREAAVRRKRWILGPVRTMWPTTVQPGPLLGATPKIARANLPAGELGLEGVAVDAERARGLAHVAVDAVEHAQDHLALEPVGGLVERHRLAERVAGGPHRELHRQVVHADRSALDQHRRALDDVLQLAHVAGPAVGAQGRQRLRRRPVDPLAELVVEATDEVPDEQRDVLAARAQRRHRQVYDVQPVVEVVAEAAAGDGLGEVDVRGGDDAHVDLDRAAGADPLDLAPASAGRARDARGRAARPPRTAW